MMIIMSLITSLSLFNDWVNDFNEWRTRCLDIELIFKYILIFAAQTHKQKKNKLLSNKIYLLCRSQHINRIICKIVTADAMPAVAGC